MVTRLNSRKLAIIFSMLMLVVTVLQPVSGFASTSSVPKKTCKEYKVPVALAEGQPAEYHVAGTLCSRGNPEGKTVQVLVHGYSLDQRYWDFPYQPQKYSYVNDLTKKGYVTFSIDRIGVGKSSHPPATQVTMDSNAYVLHQVVQKLRAGDIGSTSFSKVMLVGHSLGSLTSLMTAGKYGNVDGLVLTGLLHPINALNMLSTLTGTVPAQLDPVFKDDNYPVGYLTLSKEARKNFYNLDNIDPKILDVDNKTKGTGTATELATIDDILLPTLSKNIKAPILFAVGEKDSLFCDGLLTDCSSSAKVLEREKPYYPNAASLDAFVLPNAGHNMNYELNAPDLYKAIADWSDRIVGTKK